MNAALEFGLKTNSPASCKATSVVFVLSFQLAPAHTRSIPDHRFKFQRLLDETKNSVEIKIGLVKSKDPANLTYASVANVYATVVKCLCKLGALEQAIFSRLNCLACNMLMGIENPLFITYPYKPVRLYSICIILYIHTYSHLLSNKRTI